MPLVREAWFKRYGEADVPAWSWLAGGVAGSSSAVVSGICRKLWMATIRMPVDDARFGFRGSACSALAG